MTIKELERISKKLRFEAVRMVYEGKDGHPGPALSIADIVTTLYFDEMRIDPRNPNWEDRDRFILSTGHACPILYAALSIRGYFGNPVKDFKLRALGSKFQGHPDMRKTPGVDMTSGSLGNGLSIGCGMAIAGKYMKKNYYVYIIAGDGELQEGVVWEGANTAASKKLDNLILFVDKNGLQSGGSVVDIMGVNNPKKKFEAFNWHVQEIDGHNIAAIKKAIAVAKSVKGKPSAIICNCVKGKGLEFMENDNSWHKRVPTDEQFQIAVKVLGGEE